MRTGPPEAPRPVAVLIALVLVVALLLVLASRSRGADKHQRTVGHGVVLFDKHSAEWWARKARREHRRVLMLRRRWRPTVHYALTLASRVSGIPYRQLSTVAWCESTHDPFAANGRYRGLFQLGWYPFGLSPYDPVANALSAALTVVHDGGWRQWECQP